MMSHMRSKRWSQEEDKYLADNLGILTIQQIADHLGRSFLAVQGRVHIKGYCVYCTKEQKKMVLSLYPIKTASEIAKLSGLTTDAVYKIAQRNGLRKREYYDKTIRYENSRTYKLIRGII